MNQNQTCSPAESLLDGAERKVKEATYREHLERTKPWNECTEAQKLDRLRDSVREMRQSFRWVNDRFGRIETMLNRLEYHQHGGDGTVLIRPRDAERGYGVVEAAQQAFDPLA